MTAPKLRRWATEAIGAIGGIAILGIVVSALTIATSPPSEDPSDLDIIKYIFGGCILTLAIIIGIGEAVHRRTRNVLLQRLADRQWHDGYDLINSLSPWRILLGAHASLYALAETDLVEQRWASTPIDDRWHESYRYQYRLR